MNEAIEMTKEKEFGLVKWDCEGAEWEAFESMFDLNRLKIKHMVGEWHNGTGIDFLKMAKKCFSNFNFDSITDANLGQGRFAGNFSS